jgi:predicted nucleotidyltransferase
VQNVHTQNRTLKTIAPKVAQIVQQFVSDIQQILKDLLVAEYLFGSYATNTQSPLSDIDILILVSKNSPELQRQMSGLASQYSLEYDVCLSPILQDIEVWKKNQRARTLFYQEVTTYGIPL